MIEPTPEQEQTICAFLRAGCFLPVAAEAAGVPRARLEYWLRRARRRPLNEPCRRLAESVRRAVAHARLAAETAVLKAPAARRRRPSAGPPPPSPTLPATRPTSPPKPCCAASSRNCSKPWNRTPKPGPPPRRYWKAATRNGRQKMNEPLIPPTVHRRPTVTAIATIVIGCGRL
jgi:hypothetical protein